MMTKIEELKLKFKKMNEESTQRNAELLQKLRGDSQIFAKNEVLRIEKSKIKFRTEMEVFATQQIEIAKQHGIEHEITNIFHEFLTKI